LFAVPKTAKGWLGENELGAYFERITIRNAISFAVATQAKQK